MTRLKICGLRDAANALAAADAGADFLGFNFVPGARRQLSQEQAKDIIPGYRGEHGPDGPRLVGLFADQPLEFVAQMAGECGLDLVQLCGDEPPEYWQALPVPVFRVVRVRDDGPVEQAVAETSSMVERVASMGHTALLDKYEAGQRGGTGRSFDWSIAEEVAKAHDFMLAGGLTPGNVGQAIERVRPWGVDVSSGVETRGVKDAGKIRAFAEAVRTSSCAPVNRQGRRPHPKD